MLQPIFLFDLAAYNFSFMCIDFYIKLSFPKVDAIVGNTECDFKDRFIHAEGAFQSHLTSQSIGIVKLDTPESLQIIV